MNTGLDPNPELDLVRRVDPMRKPGVQANAGLDTEAALRRLVPTVDRSATSRTRRRRRPSVRIAVIAVAVAAAVFVAVNVVSPGGESAVSPAQARAILRHVRDALTFPPRAIYEEAAVTTVTARDGARSTAGYHEWLSTSWPYNDRSIQIQNGKVQWEQAFVRGRLDLFVPATDTVYLQPPGGPRICGGHQGSARNGGGMCQAPDNPRSNSALSEVRDLLGQSNVTVNPHAVLDGTRAIELTFDDGRFSYWVSPRNYQPLQSEDRADRLPDGQGGVGITRYPIARALTGPAAAPSLLSLQAQHPHARVDHGRTEYDAALRRLHLSRPPFYPSVIKVPTRR